MNHTAQPSCQRRLLNTEAAADYISMAAGTLENWRYQKKGPKWVRLPGGDIRYDVVDLDAWIDELKKDPAA